MINPKRYHLTTLLALVTITTMTTMQGCIVPALVGGMAESHRRTGSTTYDAEYSRIEGKSFAVVCSASRVIEAEHPGITARINQRVNDRLIQNANPSYAIPSNDLLTVLYNTPQWPAMTREDIANMLGVERLIVIEIVEYTLELFQSMNQIPRSPTTPFLNAPSASPSRTQPDTCATISQKPPSPQNSRTDSSTAPPGSSTNTKKPISSRTKSNTDRSS